MSNQTSTKLRAGLFGLGEENLGAENTRLWLAIALLLHDPPKFHDPPKAKGGRPPTRPEAGLMRAELEQERERLRRRDGKSYTNAGVIREIVREIGKQKGGTPEVIERFIKGIKFKQRLKTLQNQLGPAETSRKPKRTNNGKK